MLFSEGWNEIERLGTKRGGVVHILKPAGAASPRHERRTQVGEVLPKHTLCVCVRDS